ncbi:DUF4177 domain-containing protein [Bacillus spizizenii]|nr:DUF4177 domain-containing protein [Bacillus spizizenii]MCY7886742.1 DUF4177 domain-containing protein [Bacillus spizizenii]MCY8125670.1 DUF4177 domain-containing protein [Bacillus spizizenii]MCY8166580.1 DUF4177 domain-containing protein [Bacillus spizizenii]MCY8189745.1 DUF4177 domain-containing protein [Bacillus spizizenii]
MKEYRFIKVSLKGVKGLKSQPLEDYKEIINEHAKAGWEFIQIFSPGNSLYGSSSYFEIIMGRDVSK